MEIPAAILVVDDRDSNLLALEAILSGAPGVSLATARTGREAIDLARGQEFAAVILDAQMHPLDGYDTAERIRDTSAARSVPIIFLTAYDLTPEALRRAYSDRIGAVDFLTKPVAPEVLRAKVAVFVELFRRAERLKILERERWEAEEQRRGAERTRFLSEATAILSSSLDLQDNLDFLARLAVPRLADWCLVEILEDGTAKGQRSVAHFDPAKAAMVEELRRRYPIDIASTYGPAQVLRTGRPELYRDAPRELLGRSAGDPEWDRLMKTLGLTSAAIVPLLIGGKAIGALSLVSGESGRRYGPADIGFAEELAARACTAIANSKLYDAAQNAIQRRDEFLSLASHELKTPLASLELYLASARTGASEGSAARIDKARRQVERLTRFIDELLDVSRVNLGRLSFRLEAMDLCALVNDVVARFQAQADSAGSSLDVGCEGEITGRWDHDRLDQAFSNLLGNALKFGEGKPVSLRVMPIPNGVRITVRDHGIGIAQDDQARIFERFERAAPARHFGGMGLGLWITKHIVAGHGGTIEVASHPGQGSLFTVDLPLNPGDPPDHGTNDPRRR
jgi:signal transduction histidine kinase